jgi:hypothetical protein
MSELPKPDGPFLPKEVALRIAEVARLPADRDQFADLVYAAVEDVWNWDRRASSSTPGQALLDAAEAARTFHQQLIKLNKDDCAWLEKLVAQTIGDKSDREGSFELPWHDGGLSGLRRTAYRLAHLFSMAVGKSPPPGLNKSIPKTVKDFFIPGFGPLPFLCCEVDQREAHIRKNAGSGTLVDVLEILADYLPKGVVPARDDLPCGTIERIRSRPYPDDDEADPAAQPD